MKCWMPSATVHVSTYLRSLYISLSIIDNMQGTTGRPTTRQPQAGGSCERKQNNRPTDRHGENVFFDSADRPIDRSLHRKLENEEGLGLCWFSQKGEEDLTVNQLRTMSITSTFYIDSSAETRTRYAWYILNDTTITYSHDLIGKTYPVKKDAEWYLYTNKYLMWWIIPIIKRKYMYIQIRLPSRVRVSRKHNEIF